MSTLQRKPVIRVGLLILLLCLLACFTAQEARAQTNVVRLAVVNAPAEGGLLGGILPDFERQTGFRVEVYSGSDVTDRARNGQADLLIAHYGYAGLESFMADGFGLWPRFVFGNRNAIIGPSSDPARVRDLSDAVEGFRSSHLKRLTLGHSWTPGAVGMRSSTRSSTSGGRRVHAVSIGVRNGNTGLQNS